MMDSNNNNANQSLGWSRAKTTGSIEPIMIQGSHPTSWTFLAIVAYFKGELSNFTGRWRTSPMLAHPSQVNTF